MRESYYSLRSPSREKRPAKAMALRLEVVETPTLMTDEAPGKGNLKQMS